MNNLLSTIILVLSLIAIFTSAFAGLNSKILSEMLLWHGCMIWSAGVSVIYANKLSKPDFDNFNN